MEHAHTAALRGLAHLLDQPEADGFALDHLPAPLLTEFSPGLCFKQAIGFEKQMGLCTVLALFSAQQPKSLSFTGRKWDVPMARLPEQLFLRSNGCGFKRLLCIAFEPLPTRIGVKMTTQLVEQCHLSAERLMVIKEVETTRSQNLIAISLELLPKAYKPLLEIAASPNLDKSVASINNIDAVHSDHRLCFAFGFGLAVLQFKKLAPSDGKTLTGLPVADDVLTDAKLFCELANPASGVDCVLKDLHGDAILTPE